MDFPTIEPLDYENDGLSVMPLVGGCSLYIPYSHEIDVDSLHNKLNNFDAWQRKNDQPDHGLLVLDDLVQEREDSFVSDIYEMADIVYEWSENNPQK